jgi:hypothetical protein
MAEFPRCAMCRVSIEPGQSVVFRTDGRVAHVACPEVVCPVRTRQIFPGDAIRRNGEEMLHGNCWVKRSRVMAGGASASPWTVFERLLAGGAEDLAEAEAAAAEVFAESRALRCLSAFVCQAAA